MAARSWAGSTLTAIGVAAGTGAAQLGVGYGLGIVAWVPDRSPDGGVAWLATLVWVLWIAASSTVLGAIVASRLATTGSAGGAGSAGGGTGSTGSVAGGIGSTRDGPRPRPTRPVLVAWRLTLALAAAVGATVTVPFVAVPSRAAQQADNFAPQWTAAGYAIVGVIVGLAVAIAALSARAVAANVVTSVVYLWVLAVLAVADGLLAGDDRVVAKLAIWEFSDGPKVYGFYVPGVLTMLVMAFLIGLLAAWRAARRGDSRAGVVISGAFGPLLVAAAYLLAAPRFAGKSEVDVSQWSAYLFAPYAVIAGLAGSVLITALSTREAAAAAQPGALRHTGPATTAGRWDDEPADLSSTSDSESSTVELTKSPVDLGSGDGEPGRTPEPVAPRHPDEDLADDAYAPARAYGRRNDPDASAYATDTVETDPAPAPAPAKPPAAGGKPTRAPLWPTGPGEDSGGSPRPGKGRRPKR